METATRKTLETMGTEGDSYPYFRSMFEDLSSKLGEVIGPNSRLTLGPAYDIFGENGNHLCTIIPKARLGVFYQEKHDKIQPIKETLKELGYKCYEKPRGD